MARDFEARSYSIETLALMPTWNCDVACHHCVFTSSPRQTTVLDVKVACEAIAEVSLASTVRRVTVSGGEPFLRFEYLTMVAEEAARRSLAFRVVSNGTFGKDPALAVHALRRLRAIGLESVAISWDQFHERFIEPEHVVNSIRACRAAGISVRLTVVATRSHGIAQALAALGDEGFEIPATQVKCLPVGRARRKVKSNELLSAASHDRGRACRSDFDTLALTPNGEVYPCCAVGGFTQGICLGNYPENSMRELLAKCAQGLKWSVLASQGPRYFSDRMTTAEKASLEIDESLHDCVVCNRIFGCATGSALAERALADIKKEAAELYAVHADNA